MTDGGKKGAVTGTAEEGNLLQCGDVYNSEYPHVHLQCLARVSAVEVTLFCDGK